MCSIHMYIYVRLVIHMATSSIHLYACPAASQFVRQFIRSVPFRTALKPIQGGTRHEMENMA